MQLRLSVTDTRAGQSTDFTVDGRSHHTMADLAAVLSTELGLTDGSWSCRGRPLGPEALVGQPPLLDGVGLTYGSSPPADNTSEGPPSSLVLDLAAGPDAGGSLALTAGRHVVGRDSRCDLVVGDERMSREHCALQVSTDGVDVVDLGSTNGTLLHGIPVSRSRLRPGDHVVVGDSRLVLRAAGARPAARSVPGDGTIQVRRSPRVPGRRFAASFELPRPPSPPVAPRAQWLAILLPLPVCAVLALVWGPQLLAFALLGPVVSGGTTLGERRSGRRRYAAELAEHGRRTAEVRGRIEEALALERSLLLAVHPDPAEVLRTGREQSARLWERGSTDPACVRLGTADIDSCITVVDPMSSGLDPPVVAAGPLTVDLREVRVLGVAGPAKRRDALARSVVAQLVVLHGPTHLRLWVAEESEDSEGAEGGEGSGFGWTRWLPHRQRLDLGTGVVEHLADRLVDPGGDRVDVRPGPGARVGAVEARGGAIEARGGAIETSDGVDVLLVPADAGERSPRGLGRLTGAGGPIVIVLADHVEELPPTCGAVLDLGAESGPGHQAQAVLSVSGRAPIIGPVPDGVSVASVARLARALAPLRDVGSGRPRVPEQVALRDVLRGAAALGLSTSADAPAAAPLVGPATSASDPRASMTAADVMQAWHDPPPGLRSVIGRTESEALSVDLVSDGPHALVGGTTGAGKSELLQTLVVGLAAAYPPELLSVLLIDYKGGAAFRECAALPHVVGLVTDLDSRLAQRALTGLHAELRRRESVLARARASDLEEYRRTADPTADPLPRLVIVIDEFRMLVEELPAFVEGVVRLAAVGRSLGLHLVLATQRPAGAITADIQANVNLRIALRVRDRGDSEHVIDAPDAALLPEAVPGRALMSTGSGRPILFQAAWGGAVTPRADAGPRVSRGLSPPLARTGHDGPTDLARAVEAVTRAAAGRGSASAAPPWLPPLPATMSVDALPDDATDGMPIGLVDLPASQTQPVLTWSVRGQPVVGVVGGPGCGRTTLVRALVGQLGKASTRLPVHVYAVDGSGALAPLAALPTVGAVVAAQDTVRLRRLVDRLQEEVRRRSAALAARQLTSIAEWQTSDPATAPAYLLLVVDGWDVLADPGSVSPGTVDELGLVEDLRGLIENGAAAGLRAVLTGGRALMLGRSARLCGTTIALGRLDPADAVLLGLPRPDALPAIPGRGVRLEDGAEVQIAHLGQDPSGTGQVASVAALATMAARAAPAAGPGRAVPPPDPGRVPFAVGAMPDTVRLDALPAGHGFVCVDDAGAPLGLDPVVDGRGWLVAGPRRSGRSTTLAAIGTAYASTGLPVVWVSGRGRPPAGVTLPGDAVVVGPQDVDQLVAAKTAEPRLVVLVDDADQLAGSAVEAVLVEVARVAERDGGLVVCSVDPTTLAALFRGVAVEVARHRTGFLLSPASVVDGDALGVRVPRSPSRVPGRGFLVSAGQTTHVQVATPATDDANAA